MLTGMYVESRRKRFFAEWRSMDYEQMSARLIAFNSNPLTPGRLIQGP